MAIQVQKFVCNPFQENTYIVFDEKSGDALVVDPGFYNDKEFSYANDFVKDRQLRVIRALNTHLHLDHCIGAGIVQKKWNVTIEASVDDLFLIENAERQAEMFGLEFSDELPCPQKFLRETDIIKLGEVEFKVLDVPGHSPGGLAFYAEKLELIFVGDTLFRGSYGRTDLPGGNENQLMNSIRNKLLTLPENTVVCCGHGPETTIGKEKVYF